MARSTGSCLPLIYKAAERDGENIVIEEYIEGDILDFLLQDALCSPAETRKIVRQLYQSLWVLHSMAAVHRDIKPGNGFLRGSDAVLIGFDAARVHLTGCTLIGRKTTVLAHGHSWLHFRCCAFQDNAVGFRFNASQGSITHSQFNDNRFTGNGTDIDNRSGWRKHSRSAKIVRTQRDSLYAAVWSRWSPEDNTTLLIADAAVSKACGRCASSRKISTAASGRWFSGISRESVRGHFHPLGSSRGSVFLCSYSRRNVGGSRRGYLRISEGAPYQKKKPSSRANLP